MRQRKGIDLGAPDDRHLASAPMSRARLFPSATASSQRLRHMDALGAAKAAIAGQHDGLAARQGLADGLEGLPRP